MYYYAFVLLCCAVLLAYGQDNFQLSYVTAQMDEYCRLRGPAAIGEISQPVTTSRVGKAGPRGPQGPPGRNGKVDYSRVREIVKEITDPIFAEFRAQIMAMEMRVNNTRTPVTVINPEHCKVQYRGKCFWAVNTHERAETTFLECTSNGGHPANIYDDTHFELLREYVTTIADNEWDDYFTGMTYDPATGTKRLYDGTTTSYVKWLSSGPYGGDTATMLMFDVNSDASLAGMWNLAPGSSQEGVLCEIEA